MISQLLKGEKFYMILQHLSPFDTSPRFPIRRSGRLKDNSHNLIFGIDKRFVLCSTNRTTLTKLSLPKGGGG
jgi:hypothetical protein